MAEMMRRDTLGYLIAGSLFRLILQRFDIVSVQTELRCVTIMPSGKLRGRKSLPGTSN